MPKIEPGYILRNLVWETARLNNWLEAEVTRVDAATLDAMPMRQLHPFGKPLQPFMAERADIEQLVSQGKMEIVPVVETEADNGAVQGG